MIITIARTFKKLFSDKRGEDLAEVSSGLSKGAKTAIALGAIAAAAAGTNSLSNSANAASDKAAEKINAPTGAQAQTTQQSQAVYK